MNNPYRIRLRNDGKWEVFRPSSPNLSFPDSVGTERKAFAYMAKLIGTTPADLRRAGRTGTLCPVVE